MKEDDDIYDVWVEQKPVHASDISQECVDEMVKCGHDWGSVTDNALIEEVRRRGFTIRDAQISSKREWVGLTEEEFSELLYFGGRFDHVEVPLIADFMRAVQAKLKEKNT